ncbi:MAG: hypothetical protein SF162_12450 [bacterium]|nr:hypothetical protein [bacterium]
MSTQTHWLIPGQVIYTRLDGIFTLRDFQEMVAQIDSMGGGHPNAHVHVIVDGTRIERTLLYPADIVRVMLNANWFRPGGWVVGLTRNKVDGFLATLAVQVFGVRGHYVLTIDDALHFLSQQDAALPPLDDLQRAYLALDTRLNGQPSPLEAAGA